jgi:Recombinational DNA repair protein (RecE pathway)
MSGKNTTAITEAEISQMDEKAKVVDLVASRIRAFQENQQIDFPPNYSVENALKSAWLVLQNVQDKNKKLVLEVCNKASIANALLNMSIQGLSPAKNQCYFIAYGDQLTLSRSYFGTMAVTKRVTGASEIYAQCIFDGDELRYSIRDGNAHIESHKQSFANIKNDKIIGAYCVIKFPDGREDFARIMTMEQIQASWKKSPMNPNGDSSTHKQFPVDMSLRTVINKTCKMLINTSDDSSLLVESFLKTSEIANEAALAAEISENANQEMLDVEDADYAEIPDEQTPPVPEEAPSSDPGY